MADDPSKSPTPAPPIPDSIPITDPTASQNIQIDPNIIENQPYDPAKDKRAPFLKVKPNEAGPTVEAAPEPSLAERAAKVVTEGIPRYSSRTVENPKFGQEQFLSPEEALTPEQQRQAPVLTGALEAAGGLTSPATVSTVAATAGLGEAGIIPKVLSGLFAGQIAASVYDQYPALKDAVNRAQTAKTQQEHDDAFGDAQKILTHMGADTVMGLLAAKHGAEGAKEILDATTGSGVPDQASTFKAPESNPAPGPEETHPEMNRDTVKKLQKLGYSNQHITNFNIGEIRDILKNETPASEYKPTSEAKTPAAPEAKTPPAPDALAEVGGKLVSPSAETSATAETTPATETEEEPDLIMSAKIGGKKVAEPPAKAESTVLAERAPGATKGLVEKSTGDAAADAAIKEAGGVPAGVYFKGEPYEMTAFHDPKTGSTLNIKAGEKVTPELIRQKLAASRQAYGIKPEPDALAPAQGKMVGDTAAPKYHPYLQKVLDISGPLHTNPAKLLERPAFITPDGKISNLPAGRQHPEIITQALGEPHNESADVRPKFLDDTGAVRVRFHPTSHTLTVSVPKTGVTPEQIDMIKQGVGQVGRNGDLALERSDVNSENLKDAFRRKEFARPSDVEDALREIGAHPEQTGKDIVQGDMAHSPFKETYEMEVGPEGGDSQMVPIEANTPKEALKAAQKKFPDAGSWRINKMPEESQAPTEYTVPTGKPIKMPPSEGRPEIDTIRHELGHVFSGTRMGMKQNGMISASHPDATEDMRAGVKWKTEGLIDFQKRTIKEEKLPAVIASYMGGIAADEEFNGLHRSANHNFDLRAGGDGTTAYKFLREAGYSHEGAMNYMHQKIDENIEYLKHPVVSQMMHENAGVRESGLSRQYHFSPERLNSIVAETNRRMKNAEQSDTGKLDNGAINETGDKNRPADVARTEGGTSEATGRGPEEGEEGIVSADKKKSKEMPEKTISAAVDKFNEAHGREPINAENLSGVDPRVDQMAEWYKNAKHEPNNPEVKNSYDALKRDVDEQYDLAKKLGITLQPVEGDTYANEYEGLREDVNQNKNVKVWKGGDFPKDHPLAQIDKKTGMPYYEKLLGIHDLFGHFAHDKDFSLKGEENAWNMHRQMFSPEAQAALANETRVRGAYSAKYDKYDSKAAIPPVQFLRRAEDLGQLQEAANKFNKAEGRPAVNPEKIADEPRLKQIGEAYAAGKHEPENPAVKKSYDALKRDIDRQYDMAVQHGYSFDAQEHDPYEGEGEGNEKNAYHQLREDATSNRHVSAWKGGAPPADHPLSEVDPKTGMTYNEKFRAIHDLFGHVMHDNDFTTTGEENAWNAHRQMFSKDALPALATETRGQLGFHNKFGKFADQRAQILPEHYQVRANEAGPEWHETAGKAAATDEAGGIDPRTGKSDTTGVGTEIMPELRQPLDHAPTAQDFKNFYDANKEIFDKYPELRIGWDNKSAVEGGHEINIGAVGEDAKRVAKKLDQKSAFDIAKGDIIPTGGTGLRTNFPNYPLEDRIKDLKGENYSDVKNFEHLSKPVYDNLEPDEREYLEGNKTLQRNVMAQYHKIDPSVAETTNAMQAGAALGGWWKRYINVFHGLADGGEAAAQQIGPSHAEVLKQWHAAVSGNKSVQDANNLAWHSYADWLDAGKPTDRKSIDDIVRKNGAQPEGSGKKSNAAISDTLTRTGKIKSKGLDTTKLFNLVNSPEMKGERPFHGDVFREDMKNPLAGTTEGARKIPSMGATVAGKGNLNRLVIDAHIRDFYGHKSSSGPAAQYIADSVHLRQAAEALGLKGGEGQEQLWGTVLGLKTLLKEGLTPAEAGGKVDADLINSIGKDYAEVILNDPEIVGPGGVLDKLAEKYGIGGGSAGVGEAYRQARITGAGESQPGGSEKATDPALLAKTAERVRGQISESKIKTPKAAAPEEEGDTSFNFGANTEPETPIANPWKSAPKKSKGPVMDPVKLIEALRALREPGTKK